MARTLCQGTRQAPIIIDDDDEEEDDIAFVVGPSRLAQRPPTAHTRLTETEFNVSHSTSTVPNYSASASNPTLYMPDLGMSQRIAREADVPRDDRPYLDIARPESSISGPMPGPMLGPLTLKRKRNPQDAQGPTRTPLPPLSSFFIPLPPDPFAGLSKKQRKKLRKRLRAEQEAKSRITVPKTSKPSLAAPIPLPDKPASVALPADNGKRESKPCNRPKSSIPGQESASPSYVPDAAAPPAPHPAQDALSTTRNSRAASIQAHPLPPKPPSSNAFGPSTRSIGRHTLPGLGFGLFPVSPDQYVSHDPVRTLVLENLPKRFRSIEFVLQWCRDIKLASDPDPLHVDVMRKLGKALIEFATPAQAMRAFSSPKLANGDGRDQITAYWFSPLTSIPGRSCAAAQLPSRPAPSPPVLPSADQKSSPLYARPVRGVSPPTSMHVDPFMPYLRPMHYPQSIHTSPLEGRMVPPPKDAPYPASHSSSDNSLPPGITNEYERHDGEEVEEGEIVGVEQTGSITEGHRETLEYSTILPSPKKFSTQSSPECEYSCIEAVAPSVHDLPHPSQIDVMDSIEDEKTLRGRRETPQPVPTSLEIFGSIASPAAGSLTEPELRIVFASRLTDDETMNGMDVDNSAISLPPGPNDPRLDPQSSSSIPPPLPVTQNMEIDGVEQQPSGPAQHGLVVSDVSTAEGKDGSSRDPKRESLPQNLSQKLSELRERVLASKRRRTAAQEMSVSSPQKVNSSLSTTTPNSIMSGDADISSAQSLNSSIMSTLASASAESLFSSASLASSSMSSVGESSLPKSASYIDNMADALLEDILGPAKMDSSVPSRDEPIIPPSGNPPSNATTITQKREKRVREHIAKAKALLAQWETAGSKSEKTRIWTLLKEEERSFEAEKAAVDTQLKQLETRKYASSRAGRRSFGKWPQTNPDEMILTLSDNEDDDSA